MKGRRCVFRSPKNPVSAHCETDRRISGDGAERHGDEWAVAWINWDVGGEGA